MINHIAIPLDRTNRRGRLSHCGEMEIRSARGRLRIAGADDLKNKIECLRRKLHSLAEKATDHHQLLQISRQLDLLIVKSLHSQVSEEDSPS